MKILFVAAEVAPLTKVGGLADVVRSLPIALSDKGHDVRTIVPKYGFIDYGLYKTAPVIDNLTVFSLGEYRKVSVEKITVDKAPVYLLSGDIFARSAEVYGDDEVEKFFVLCDAVCQTLPYLGWNPEIVHCHDWHTALLPLLLRNKYPECRSVFTIHNIKYQGNIDEYTLNRSGLNRYWQAIISGGPAIPWNFMAQGILWSNAINTVSENFAREILTPGYGCGMQDLLRFRQHNLSGILNGLGDEEYDPDVDTLIPVNFSSADVTGKHENKTRLQQSAGFAASPGTPLCGMVSRMVEQKGLDIIIQSVPDLLAQTDLQFVFLGNGTDYYEEMLLALEKRFPHKVKVFNTYDNTMAHLIYAGSDMFLMPSKWEPCGLSQMIAMKYGAVPVVRKTGGLADTVTNLSNELKKGSGFVFTDYSAGALTNALKNAAAAYNKSMAWEQAIKRIMKQDFSWKVPAEKYEILYKKAMEL